jgi:hypothetical protein
MRRAGWIAALCFMAACNANPLLHEASADYAPLKAGDTWTYDACETTTVGPEMMYQGRMAFTLGSSNCHNNALGAVSVSFDGGNLLRFDGTAWRLYRRLPYVIGNSWPIFSYDPTLTINTIVDSTENISLASGYYANCFKLRTVTQAYSGGVTTTTEADAWVAPDIGDVQYGQVDASGTASVTSVLTAYQVH